MNKKHLSILLLSTLFLSETYASQKKIYSQKAFKNLDKNNNGTIEKNEYLNTLNKRFDKFDKNSDGEVTQKEIKSTFIGKRKPQLVELWMKKYDENLDKVVSKNEVQDINEKIFLKIDKNIDAKLSKEELQNY